jgi:hypothetical protein
VILECSAEEEEVSEDEEVKGPKSKRSREGEAVHKG